ncbi:hypothetical protein BKA62DRAFT_695390 [Auriculariales sp. MPI-PUGE-AT-0066]|nr:hypothetical protein BKA62DRAFT_695390 [Auriculariales sp. MPI-PUGE-AT-0066]
MRHAFLLTSLICALPSALAQSRTSTSTSTSTAAQPTGSTISVRVGDGGPNFNPSSISTRVGDIVEFVFVAGNHTATQTAFSAPCSSFSNVTSSGPGFDSGFYPAQDGAATFQTWRIQVFNKDPIWVACRRPEHCSQGMVFAINPTMDKTFDAFQTAAKGPGNAGNGVVSSVAPPRTLGSILFFGTLMFLLLA